LVWDITAAGAGGGGGAGEAAAKLLSKGASSKRATNLCFDSQNCVVIIDKAGDAFSYDYTQEPSKITLLCGAVSMLLGVAIINNGKQIVTSDRDEKIRISKYPGAYDIDGFCFGHTEFVSTVAAINGQDGAAPRLVSGSGDGTVRLWDTTTYKLLCTIQIEMAPPPETEAVAEAATEAATAGAAATEGGGEGGDGSSGAAAAGGGGGGGGAAAAATKEAGAGAGEAAPERWRKSSKPKNALLRTVLSSPLDGTVAAITSQATKIHLYNATEASLEPAGVLDVGAVISSIAFLRDGSLWALSSDKTAPALAAYKTNGGGAKFEVVAAEALPACAAELAAARDAQTESGMLKLEDLVKVTDDAAPDVYWERKRARIEQQQAAVAADAGKGVPREGHVVGNPPEETEGGAAAAAARGTAAAAANAPKENKSISKRNRNKRKPSEEA